MCACVGSIKACISWLGQVKVGEFSLVMILCEDPASPPVIPGRQRVSRGIFLTQAQGRDGDSVPKHDLVIILNVRIFWAAVLFSTDVETSKKSMR